MWLWGACALPSKLSLWVARSVTILGAILAVGGFLFTAFFWPGSISDPVFAGMLIILDLVSTIAGLTLLGLGTLFQKMKHDEWMLWGVQPPRGPQKKCVHCGGLMNVDTGVCPFCGTEVAVEPLTWSTEDPSTPSKPKGNVSSSQEITRLEKFE